MIISWVASIIGLIGTSCSLYKKFLWMYIFWSLSNIGFLWVSIERQDYGQMTFFLVGQIVCSCGIIKVLKGKIK